MTWGRWRCIYKVNIRELSEKGKGVQVVGGLEGVFVLVFKLIVELRVQRAKAQGASGLDGLLEVFQCRQVC